MSYPPLSHKLSSDECMLTVDLNRISTNLKELDLSGINLINIDLKPLQKLFPSSNIHLKPSLEILKLHKNRIRYIDLTPLQKSSLKYLDLSQNKIHNINLLPLADNKGIKGSKFEELYLNIYNM